MQYVATCDFSVPYVLSTGRAVNPIIQKTKRIKKGEVLKGVLKSANGRPAFLLLKNPEGAAIVVPAEYLKEVKLTELNSNASGGSVEQKTLAPISVDVKNNKVRYMDAILVGGVIGALGVYFAEKKGWLKTPSHKNKLIGAGVGSALAFYAMYRFKGAKVKK